MNYQIVRYYLAEPGKKRVIARGFTLREVKAHCADPETAWHTCAGPTSTALTVKHGAWFDHYEPEPA